MPAAAALDWMHWLVRLVLVAVLLPSAFGKLRNWSAFVAGVAA